MPASRALLVFPVVAAVEVFNLVCSDCVAL